MCPHIQPTRPLRLIVTALVKGSTVVSAVVSSGVNDVLTFPKQRPDHACCELWCIVLELDVLHWKRRNAMPMNMYVLEH